MAPSFPPFSRTTGCLIPLKKFLMVAHEWFYQMKTGYPTDRLWLCQDERRRVLNDQTSRRSRGGVHRSARRHEAHEIRSIVSIVLSYSSNRDQTQTTATYAHIINQHPKKHKDARTSPPPLSRPPPHPRRPRRPRPRPRRRPQTSCRPPRGPSPRCWGGRARAAPPAAATA